MACCGLDKDRPLYVVIPIVATVLLCAAVGAAVALVLSPFSRRARKATKVICLFGVATIREVRDRVLERSYLLSPRFRCVASGKIMRVSPWLGGIIYKRTGMVLLAGLAVLALICWAAVHFLVRTG